MQKNSIAFRIPLYISIFALVCVVITGLIAQLILQYRMEDNIETKNMVISQMISSELALYIQNASDVVITAANFSTQSHGDLDKIEEEIFRIYDNFKYFDLIFYMDDQANMVFSKPTNEKVESRIYTDRDYYWKIVRDNEPSTVSALLISSVLNQPHFIIAAPVKNIDEETVGLIGAGIPLEHIKDIVDNVDAEFNGEIWIVDSKGNLIIHPDYDITTSLVSYKTLDISAFEPKTTLGDVLSKKENRTLQYELNGHTQYGAISFMKNYGWMVNVQQDAHLIQSEIFSVLQQLLLIELLVLIAAVVIGIQIAKSITKPIQRLVDDVRILPDRLIEERFVENIALEKESDEIAELSHAFHLMGQQLHGNIKELEISLQRENKVQQYLNNIISSVHSGIIVANQQNDITIINDQALKLCGYKEKSSIPRNIFSLLKNVTIDISKSQLFNGDQIIKQSNIETTLRALDGRQLIIHYSLTPVRDEFGKHLGFVFQFIDMTQVKRIEEELRREDRIYSMGELSASIIHDIGNPLAGISNLIEIISDNKIPKEQRHQALDLLQNEVNDLNILVINFLDFVRSGRNEKVSTNLADMIKGVIQLFKPELDQLSIHVIEEYEDDTTFVLVNKRSLKQAIINIMKNSIEAVKSDGHIRFKIQNQSEVISLTIEDNGCGMAPEVLEKVYNPFYTTKHDGTGLGLFIVYKTLKENDGTIHIHSIKDEGTRINMTFRKG